MTDKDPNHEDDRECGNVFHCPHCGLPIRKDKLPFNKKKKKKQKQKSAVTFRVLQKD